VEETSAAQPEQAAAEEEVIEEPAPEGEEEGKQE
jgi:hypothetical protein